MRRKLQSSEQLQVLGDSNVHILRSDIRRLKRNNERGHLHIITCAIDNSLNEWSSLNENVIDDNVNSR